MDSNLCDMYRVLNKTYSLPLYCSETENNSVKNNTAIDNNHPANLAALIAAEPKDLRIAIAYPSLILSFFANRDFIQCIKQADKRGRYCLRRTYYFYEIIRYMLLRSGLKLSKKYVLLDAIINNSNRAKDKGLNTWLDLLNNRTRVNYTPIHSTPAGEKWKIYEEPVFQKYEEFYYQSKKSMH